MKLRPRKPEDRRARRSSNRRLTLASLVVALTLSVGLALQIATPRTPPLNPKTFRSLSANPQTPEPPLIAVIDTGIDLQNPELRRFLWTNPGESGPDKNGLRKEFNGKDDDQNGFVDDVHGWNFVTETPAVGDDHGHGTHVSSLIIDSRGHAVGSFHTPPRFPGRLMILKYYDGASIEQNLERSVRAFRYAVQMKAQIINFSGGGFGQNPSEKNVLQSADAKGILVVAAAGNERVNSDRTPFFPAGYPYGNILSVGAHAKDGTWLPASNWGRQSVDIALLGEDVEGFTAGGRVARMTGTSQATALATGLASRLWSLNPELRRPEVMREYLILSSQASPSLSSKLLSEGIVDQGLSLSLANQLSKESLPDDLHFMDAFSFPKKAF